MSDREWAGKCITGCGRGRYKSARAGGITVVYSADAPSP